MPERPDFKENLDRLVGAGAVDHLLEIPIADSAAEAAVLDQLTLVAPPPVIRLQRGAYAFTMDPDSAEAVCAALAEFEGTLSAVDDVAGVDDDRKGLRRLMNAACACDTPPVLDAAFLLHAAAAPTVDGEDITQQLNRIEQALTANATENLLAEVSARVESVAAKLADPAPDPAENAVIDEIEALKAELNALSAQKPVLERIEAAVVELAVARDGPDKSSFETLLNAAMQSIDASVQATAESNLKVTDAIRRDMMTCVSLMQKLDEQFSDPARAADRAALRKTIAKLASVEPGSMALISEGERLSRITQGLQKVLDRLADQGTQLAPAPTSSEAAQNVEVEPTGQPAAMPQGRLRDVISANAAAIAGHLIADEAQSEVAQGDGTTNDADDDTDAIARQTPIAADAEDAGDQIVAPQDEAEVADPAADTGEGVDAVAMAVETVAVPDEGPAAADTPCEQVEPATEPTEDADGDDSVADLQGSEIAAYFSPDTTDVAPSGDGTEAPGDMDALPAPDATPDEAAGPLVEAQPADSLADTSDDDQAMPSEPEAAGGAPDAGPAEDGKDDVAIQDEFDILPLQVAF